MEDVTSYGEIKKHISIKKFSTYTDVKAKVSLIFNLTLENFHSEWELNVYPMHPANAKDWKPIHCDVYVELICLFSSAPPNVVKTIRIASLVKERENYPKLLELNHQCDNKPTWECAIISRVTLESLKIIKNDFLEFFIQFQFSEDILHKSEDGRNAVVKNIETILTDPHYYDTCLVSSTDSKFYVHSSILHARSNIMKTGRVLALSHTHEYHEDSFQASDDECSESIDVKSVNENSISTSSLHMSSVMDNKHELSNCRTPLFTVAANISSPKKSFSIKDQSPSIFSPKKNRMSSVTPKKKCESPSRISMQTQLTNYFPRSSSLNTKSDEGHASPFTCFSPIKTQTPSKLANSSAANSPMIKSSKENGMKTPSKQKSFISSSLILNSDLRSPCGILPKQKIQNLKRKLFDNQMEDNRNITILKLNMSTSVLQELLIWLYTGKSSRLSELSRPLLVAAIRHNIEDLAKATQFYLASTLSVNNVSDLLLLSQKYEAKVLKEEALQFAVSHASDVTVLSSWADLSMRYPNILLEFTKRLASASKE